MNVDAVADAIWRTVRPGIHMYSRSTYLRMAQAAIDAIIDKQRITDIICDALHGNYPLAETVAERLIADWTDQ